MDGRYQAAKFKGIREPEAHRQCAETCKAGHSCSCRGNHRSWPSEYGQNSAGRQAGGDANLATRWKRRSAVEEASSYNYLGTQQRRLLLRGVKNAGLQRSRRQYRAARTEIYSQEAACSSCNYNRVGRGCEGHTAYTNKCT